MKTYNRPDAEIYLHRIAALESDASLATSLMWARRSVEAAHLGPRDFVLRSRPMAVHVTRLKSLVEDKHSGEHSLATEAAASGIDGAHAYRRARYAAIATHLHAGLPNRDDVQQHLVCDYLRRPGITQALGPMADRLAQQPGAIIATLDCLRLDCDARIELPLALLSTEPLNLDGSRQPLDPTDHDARVFRRTALAPAWISSSIDGGANKNEAALQGILKALERRSLHVLDRQLAQTVAIPGLKWLPLERLSEHLLDLINETACALHGRLRLYTLSSEHEVSTCIISLDGSAKNTSCVAAGAGLNIDHAALRALGGLVRHCALKHWRTVRNDAALKQCPAQSTGTADTHARLTAGLAQIAPQRLNMLDPIQEAVMLPTTLEARVSFLLEQLARQGLHCWFLPLSSDPEQSGNYLQVLMTSINGPDTSDATGIAKNDYAPLARAANDGDG